MTGEQMLHQVCRRAPSTIFVGLTDVLDDGESHVKTDVVGVMHVDGGSSTTTGRVDHVHLSFVSPRPPQ